MWTSKSEFGSELTLNPDIPEPADGHGWTMKGEAMESLWTDGEMLPQALVNTLEETLESDNESESDFDPSTSNDVAISESSNDGWTL